MQGALQTAIEHHKSGRLSEAEPIYRRLLDQSPRDPRLLHLLGSLLLQRGNFVEATPLLRSAAMIAPGAGQTWFALAHALRLAGKWPDAHAAADRAVALKPDFPPAYNELGMVLVNRGNEEGAIAAWRRALQLKPDYADALSNLGGLLAKRKQFDDALPLLQRAVELMPNHPQARNNLANALEESKRSGEAEPHWRRALELAPDFVDALHNYGKSLLERGKYAEAKAMLDRAIALDPNHPHARFLRAMVLLTWGDYAAGFKDYEQRFFNPEFNLGGRNFPQPRWDGGDIAGKTILIHAEQGLGDMIQFVRYAPLLAERGAKVILDAQAELVQLLQTVPKVSAVIPRGEGLPAFDVHASVLSLPMLFGTTVETIPQNVPYLLVPPEREAKWAAFVGPRDGTRRVGVVWAGNAKHSNDARRSIPLAELAPILAKAPNVTFFTLQKGPAAAQLRKGGVELAMVDHTEQLQDFADTAALVNQLDLVISVDTAVAHLVGAMGKRVALLLPYVPDWRWMLEREDSPWYPTMKVYRQPGEGDWRGALARLIAELRSESAGSTKD